jgi:hypothetical protein
MPRVAEAALAEEEDALAGAASGARPSRAPSRSKPGSSAAAREAALAAAGFPATAEAGPSALVPSAETGIGVSSFEWFGPEGMSSLERPLPAPHLEVQADILIHGRAPAGSEVIIDGVPVRVRADGTFDLRLALPGDPAAPPREERP